MNQLDLRVHEALQAADIDPHQRSLDTSYAAECFYEANPELVEEIKKPWICARLAKILQHGRGEQGWSKQAFHVSTQQNLPGFEGLPQRIFVAYGEKITRKLLDDSTVVDVRKHLKALKAKFRKHPKILLIKKVLALMEKYSIADPKITWKGVREKELEFRRQAGEL